MMMKTWLRMFSAIGGATLLWLACGDDGADGYTYMPDEVPSGRCGADTNEGDEGDTEDCTETTGMGSTTEPSDGDAGSPCSHSGECNEGLVCSAPFSQGERGEFACVEACIGHMDEQRWCADASACCDPDAVCTMRGYCLSPDGSSSSAGEGSTTGDDSTTGDGSTTGDHGSTMGDGSTGDPG
jgi:hypothetical protein